MELTVGEVCKHLNQPMHRVARILDTRPHIQPIKRVGVLRIFDDRGVEAIRTEIEKMDARRRGTRAA
jgi:hypothetical protein